MTTRDRLYPVAEGRALTKRSIEETEALVRSIGAKAGIPVTIEQHRSTFEKETFRVLKATVNLIQIPPQTIYVYAYNVALRINYAFLLFLRGDPLFVDINRDPSLAMISHLASTKDHYICFCSNGVTSAIDLNGFLNQENYLVFRSELLGNLASMHLLFEVRPHQVSLSVFFATSMFVTIIFYFGLLVFLLPAYAYRTILIFVLEKCGSLGRQNAISIAIALGALPLVILLVIVSRLL